MVLLGDFSIINGILECPGSQVTNKLDFSSSLNADRVACQFVIWWVHYLTSGQILI